MQWGGADVWKVGGKVFAIGGWDDGGLWLFVTFKCSEVAFDILRDQPGLRPAPYLASRGMKWIQRQTGELMDDTALKDYLRESHRLDPRSNCRRKSAANSDFFRVSAAVAPASISPQAGEMPAHLVSIGLSSLRLPFVHTALSLPHNAAIALTGTQVMNRMSVEGTVPDRQH